MTVVDFVIKSTISYLKSKNSKNPKRHTMWHTKRNTKWSDMEVPVEWYKGYRQEGKVPLTVTCAWCCPRHLRRPEGSSQEKPPSRAKASLAGFRRR